MSFRRRRAARTIGAFAWLLTAGCAPAPRAPRPAVEAPPRPPPPSRPTDGPQSSATAPDAGRAQDRSATNGAAETPNPNPSTKADPRWDASLAKLQQIRGEDPSTFAGVDFATTGDCALLVRARDKSTTIDMRTLHFTTLNSFRRAPEPGGQVAYYVTVQSDHGYIEVRTGSPAAAFRISNELVYLGQLCGSERPMWGAPSTPVVPDGR